MPPIADDLRLPADVDAEPLVRAAAALRSIARSYREELEREQRLPKALVEQLHAAGFSVGWNVERASRLAECWRDLQVVGQTVTLAPEWYPIGGRVHLGMDPGPRLR